VSTAWTGGANSNAAASEASDKRPGVREERIGRKRQEMTMRRYLRGCSSILSLLFAATALASFHTYVIDELYSNADGSVQFIVLHEALGLDGQNLLRGRTLTSTHSGVTQTYTFDRDLPGGGGPCGYFGECNPSPTANTRVLIATQGFAALGVVAPDYTIPNGFLSSAGGTVNYAGVDIVNYAALPVDGVGALNRSGTVIPNVATNFAGASASVALPPPAVFGNYQGLWWAAPPDSESGWGINLNHQGTTIFATWFTFGADGKPVWYVVSATSTPANPNVFSGNLVTGTGPPFTAFDPARVAAAEVGSVTFTFIDANTATFAYNVNGIAQTKTITREVFASPVPACTFGALANLALATNFQDIWWKAPANSESGWGINLTHQGDTIFVTWFTFGADGKPLWFVVATTKSAPNVYSGTLYRMVSGPPFSAVPFDSALVNGTPVGTVTLTFSDGNNGIFAYTVDGTSQAKPITRQVFAAPGTACQ